MNKNKLGDIPLLFGKEIWIVKAYSHASKFTIQLLSQLNAKIQLLKAYILNNKKKSTFYIESLLSKMKQKKFKNFTEGYM